MPVGCSGWSLVEFLPTAARFPQLLFVPSFRRFNPEHRLVLLCFQTVALVCTSSLLTVLQSILVESLLGVLRKQLRGSVQIPISSKCEVDFVAPLFLSVFSLWESFWASLHLCSVRSFGMPLVAAVALPRYSDLRFGISSLLLLVAPIAAISSLVVSCCQCCYSICSRTSL